jgi:hypothetical protein
MFALGDEYLSSELKILESMKFDVGVVMKQRNSIGQGFQGLAAGTSFLRNEPSIHAMQGRLDKCHAEGWK